MTTTPKASPIHALPYPEYPNTYCVAYDFGQAENFAINAHGLTNHLYDDYLPYHFHLRMAKGNFSRFKHLVHIHWINIVEAGIWLHDTIEDARITYSNIDGWFGSDVANIVYAVTNERGKNRKERESDKYFEGIRNTPYATFVKLCDRIANIEYSKMTAWKDKSKLEMYKKEHSRFKEQLYDIKYKEMFDYIDSLLGEQKEIVRNETETEWKIPSKYSGADDSLRAHYLTEDLIEVLNFIEMITRAPISKESDVELNRQAEEILNKFQ